MSRRFPLFAFAALALLASACVEDETTDGDLDGSGDGSGDGPALEDGPFALDGVWLTWGAPFVLATDEIVTGLGADVAIYTIETWSNEANLVVARNADTNEYNPGAWSRFDFVTTEAGTFFCQAAYAAASADEALDAPASEASDPRSSGCGGFAWSELATEANPPAIEGTWGDEFDTSHVVSAEGWTQTFEDETSEWEAIIYGNEAGFMLALNGADNAYNPGQFSRFEWVQTDTDSFFCQSVYDGADLKAAMLAPLADNADLATGCSGFPWTRLSP